MLWPKTPLGGQALIALVDSNTTNGRGCGDSAFESCSIRHQPLLCQARKSRTDPSSCVQAPANTKK